jgi:hypothetical protein
LELLHFVFPAMKTTKKKKKKSVFWIRRRWMRTVRVSKKILPFSDFTHPSHCDHGVLKTTTSRNNSIFILSTRKRMVSSKRHLFLSYPGLKKDGVGVKQQPAVVNHMIKQQISMLKKTTKDDISNIKK